MNYEIVSEEVVQMDMRDRITSDPDILHGKLVINGTRISGELILDMLVNSRFIDNLVEVYPRITRENSLAALAFAAEMLHDANTKPSREA